MVPADTVVKLSSIMAAAGRGPVIPHHKYVHERPPLIISWPWARLTCHICASSHGHAADNDRMIASNAIPDSPTAGRSVGVGHG